MDFQKLFVPVPTQQLLDRLYTKRTTLVDVISFFCLSDFLNNFNGTFPLHWLLRLSSLYLHKTDRAIGKNMLMTWAHFLASPRKCQIEKLRIILCFILFCYYVGFYGFIKSKNLKKKKKQKNMIKKCKRKIVAAAVGIRLLLYGTMGGVWEGSQKNSPRMPHGLVSDGRSE